MGEKVIENLIYSFFLYLWLIGNVLYSIGGGFENDKSYIPIVRVDPQTDLFGRQTD